MRPFVVLAFSFVLAACPSPTESGKSSDPVSVCTKAGVQCMFAPGKIGLCVEKPERCDGKPCFTCQSQH